MTEERPSVLVVDDRPNWRRLFSDLLEEYEVTSVGSYEKAIEALDRDPPFHVAVVDIRLDDKDQANEDGLRLIEMINERGEGTGAIVMTGYPTIRTVRKALLELKASDYMEKYPQDNVDFDWVHFREAVRAAANNAMLRRKYQAYVMASIEGIAPAEPLEVGRHYSLSLSLSLEASTSEVDSCKIEIYRSRESLVEATIDVLNMKVQPGPIREWTIPVEGLPNPLLTTLIPKRSGRQRMVIYFEVDGRPSGELEKRIEVVQAIPPGHSEM